METVGVSGLGEGCEVRDDLQGDWRPAGGKRVAQIINVDKWSGWVIVALTLGLQVVIVMLMMLVMVIMIIDACLMCQGPAAALFSRLHQAGTVSAVEWIANERNFAAYTSGDV